VSAPPWGFDRIRSAGHHGLGIGWAPEADRVNDRDAEDDALLAAGRHADLLAAYYATILARIKLKVPAADVGDVAHDVIERLLRELRRGRRYRVPFRVVVHNVVGWKLREHYARRVDEPLPPEPVAFDDPVGDAETRIGLQQMLATLPPREREVMTLRLLEGLEIVEIADRLGMTRNAVDQAIHRARARLGEALGG
jgi:RNA polymerase sigma factor (sigma-70 family)